MLSLSRRNVVLTLATAVAGLGGGDFAVEPASAASLAVLAPGDESLVTRDFDVRVRVPAGATGVTARVAGRPVKLRGGGAVRTASVSLADLRPGRATVVVRARGVGGKALFGHVGLTVGTARPSLLAGMPTVTQARGRAALRLNLVSRPTRLRVTLNGNRVHLLRLPDAGTTAVPLTAGEGLQFGPNTVRLKAYDKRTGKWVRTRTRFTMSSAAPLISAGRDVRVKAGAKVELSAAGSQARPSQLPLGYRWSIASQPKGAKAKLVGATTQRPTFKTTHPGRYRIALKLHERTRRARAATASPVAQDVVSVDAAALIPPWGTPITTLAINGNGTTRTTIQGIPLDGTNDFVDTPTNKIGLIVLDRSTLEPVSTAQLNPDPNSVLTAVNGVTADQLAIMSGAPGCCTWASNGVGPIYNPAAGWTVIFAGGNYTNPIASNSGHTVVGSNTSGPRFPGAMSGVIRKSHTLGDQGVDVFTYASTDAVRFDTHFVGSDGSITMKLGSHTSTPLSGAGIGVMAVDPDLVSLGWNQFFPLTGDATADQQQLQSLASQLKYISDNVPGAMVMLQTTGKPKPHTTAWGLVGNALTAFGGTESVWNKLDGTGDYALVARSGAGATSALQETASAESSAPLQAANNNPIAKATAGTLRGVIGRGQDALGIISGSTSAAPAAATDAGGATVQVNPFEMIALASAPPQPWPGSAAALQYISKQLGLGDPSVEGAGYCYQPTTWDLRAEYCNATQQNSWASTYANQLTALTYPSGQGFTQDEFTALVTQLAGDKSDPSNPGEFGRIAPVFDMIAALQAPIADSQARTAVDIADATSQVESDLTNSNAEDPAYGMQSFVSDFLGPLQDLSEPEDATGMVFGIGLFASALDMALGSVTDDDGNPALDTFESDKTKIADDAVSRLTDASQQMALLQEVILTDWTKLSTTAAFARSVWGLNNWSADDQTDAIQAGTRAWLWKTMLPIAYSQIAVTPKGGNTVDGLNASFCIYNGGSTYYTRWPFRPGATADLQGHPSGGSKLPASAAFAPLTATNADGSATSPFVWGLGNAIDKESLQIPSADLTDLLFMPVTSTDKNKRTGIGLYPEQFYSWGWVSSNRFQFTQIQSKLSDPASCSQ